jgi:RNA polymerase sigma-70 factor, ECF subfamily
MLNPDCTPTQTPALERYHVSNDNLIATRSVQVIAPYQKKPTKTDFSKQLIAIIPALMTFARGMCRRADLADDLTQEALLRAWAARDSYRPDTDFKAWIFTILRNHYFSWHRKQGRVVAWDADLAERLLVCAPAQSGCVEISELALHLRNLPAEQSEAVILVGAGGCSYEEAAAVFGCAVGTVKSRVARGRAALRLSLSSHRHQCRTLRPTGQEANASIFAELRRLAPAATFPLSL